MAISTGLPDSGSTEQDSVFGREIGLVPPESPAEELELSPGQELCAWLVSFGPETEREMSPGRAAGFSWNFFPLSDAYFYILRAVLTREDLMNNAAAISLEAASANPIAEPIKLQRGAAIKNRLLKSAMSEALGTTDNRVTSRYPVLYRAWARGGIGLLITGNVMIDRRALGEPNNVAIEDDRDMPLLKEWAAAATENGTQCWVQLNHPGKQSPKGLNIENLSPSAIPFKQDMQSFFDTPRAFESEEIDEVIARFGRSAAVVKQAGFSGVQIHGAHGYLVSQFLSPHTNQRTDKWGGSAENRREFVLAVYREIREQVGEDFPIGIKLNSADFQKGGFSEEESLTVIKSLEKEGIDHVEISGGTYEEPTMSGKDIRESTKQREAYFLQFAEKIRNEVKVPLAVTGGFRSAAAMNKALNEGSLDMVGLARPLAVDTEYPAKLLAGQTIDVNVNPIKTGIRAIDDMALMEVAWYGRQLHRISKGRKPKPNENAFIAFIKVILTTSFKTSKTKRLRARA